MLSEQQSLGLYDDFRPVRLHRAADLDAAQLGVRLASGALVALRGHQPVRPFCASVKIRWGIHQHIGKGGRWPGRSALKELEMAPLISTVSEGDSGEQ